ncbi:MAG: NYN domain-containing protein, partial [Patescibacteria group bacterium]
MSQKNEPQKYISLSQASQLCNYSQDYLSLRARQGKFQAIKVGRNWVTTQEWLEQYIGQVGVKERDSSEGELARELKAGKEKISQISKEIIQELEKIPRDLVIRFSRTCNQIEKVYSQFQKIKFSQKELNEQFNEFLNQVFGQPLDRFLNLIERLVVNSSSVFEKVKKSLESVLNKTENYSAGLLPRLIQPKIILSILLISSIIFGSFLVFNPGAKASLADWTDKTIGIIVKAGEKTASFVFESGQALVESIVESAGNLTKETIVFFEQAAIKAPQIIGQASQSIESVPEQLSAGFESLVETGKQAKEFSEISKTFWRKIKNSPQAIVRLIEQTALQFNQLSQKNEESKKNLKNNLAQLPQKSREFLNQEIARTQNQFAEIVKNLTNWSQSLALLVNDLPENIPQWANQTEESLLSLADSFSADAETALANLTETGSQLFQRILSISRESFSRAIKDLVFQIKSQTREGFGKASLLSQETGWRIRADIFDAINNLSQQISQKGDSVNSAGQSLYRDLTDSWKLTKSKLGQTYLKMVEYFIPGYSPEPPDPQLVATQVQQLTSQTITKESVITKQVTVTQEKVSQVTQTIESADLIDLKQQINALDGKISTLSSQIVSKVDYTVPSYAPTYIPSSGLQVAGHSILSTLNVSGSGAIGGDLSVKGSASFGNTKSNTDTFTVISPATFDSSLSAASLSASGSLSVGENLTVGGDSTFTGATVFNNTVAINNTLTATTTQITASTTDTLLTVTQNSTGHILDLKDNEIIVLTVLDGGNVGIGTTSPSVKFSVGGDAGDTTGHGYFTGGLGVGMVNTTANSFQVGQCVAGDTLLKRRRRRRKKDGSYEYVFEDVRIDQIKAGDEILTLDDKTSRLKVSKVKKLMYMGSKPIVEIITALGRKIRTTANHPYFVRANQPKTKKPKLGVFYDNANLFYAQKKAGWRIDVKKFKKSLSRDFQISAFNYYIATPDKKDEAFSKTSRFIAKIKKQVQIITKLVKYIQTMNGLKKKADMDVEIALGVTKQIKDLDIVMIVSGDSDLLALKNYALEHGKKVIYAGFKQNMAWELKKYSKYLYLDDYKKELNIGQKKTNPKPKLGVALLSLLYSMAPSLSSGGVWRKVSGLKVGQEIAVLSESGKPVWDKIKNMRKLPAE